MNTAIGIILIGHIAMWDKQEGLSGITVRIGGRECGVGGGALLSVCFFTFAIVEVQRNVIVIGLLFSGKFNHKNTNCKNVFTKNCADAFCRPVMMMYFEKWFYVKSHQTM